MKSKSRKLAAILAIVLAIGPLPRSQRNEVQAAAIAIPVVELVLISGAVGVFVTAYACNGDVRKSTQEAVHWLVEKNKFFYQLSVAALAPILAQVHYEIEVVQRHLDQAGTDRCDLDDSGNPALPEEVRAFFSSPLFKEWSTIMTGLFARYGYIVPKRISSISEVEKAQVDMERLISIPSFVSEYRAIQIINARAFAKSMFPRNSKNRQDTFRSRMEKCLENPDALKYLFSSLGYWSFPPLILLEETLSWFCEKRGLINKDAITFVHYFRYFILFLMPSMMLGDVMNKGPFAMGNLMFNKFRECVATGGDMSSSPYITHRKIAGIFLFMANGLIGGLIGMQNYVLSTGISFEDSK